MGIAPVLLVVAALVATCAGPAATPAPSGGPTAVQSTAPGAPTATPGGSQGVTPIPTPAPGSASWSAVSLPDWAQVATLEATKAVAAGALPDTAFRLTSLDGSNAAALASQLTVEPALALRVSHADARTALVTPKAPLRLGQAYRIALRDASGLIRAAWAVQAVAPLHVATTNPADQSTRVPRDTGIEVTFDQDGVALADAISHISITPAVKGHFVQEGRTVAFVPDTPLKAATVYTVTVRHGLPLRGTTMTLERDAEFAFETRGGAARTSSVAFQRVLSESPTTEGPVLTVFVQDDGEANMPDVTEVDTTVHRLPGIEAAIDAWDVIRSAPEWAESAGTAPVSTSGLVQVSTGTVPLTAFDPGDPWVKWFRLPRLDPGWYVVTIRHDDVPHQAVVQVTDVAVYALATDTRTLVWANDLHTKGPIEAARVGLLGTSLGQTNAQGIVAGPTPAALRNASEDAGPAVVTVRTGGRAAFVPVNPGGLCGKCDDTWGPTSSPYWTVFESDRYQYRTTDTINAWAVVRDRATLHAPGTVEVRLMADGADDASQPVVARTASPDRTGSILVHLALKDVPVGGYDLQLWSGDTLIADRSITVAPIVKPSWTLSLGTNKHAVVSGATVKAAASAAFFEGTPMAGARLTFGYDERERTATTSLLGTAAASFRMRYTGSWSQWETQDISVRPTNPEEGSISETTQVAVFKATVLVRLAPVHDGNRLILAGSVNRVAFARYERPGLTWLDEVDPYGAGVAGASVRLAVTEHHWTRVQTGTVYDFITKRTVPTYDSVDHPRALAAHTVQTDAKGNFRLVLDVEGTDRTYEARATTHDSAGRQTSVEEGASSPADDESSDWASIEPVKGSPEAYSVGDRVRVELRDGAGETASSRYLWSVTQAGLRSWHLTTSPTFSTTFTKASVPGISIFAVHFDGSAYEAIEYPVFAPFRAADRTLGVRITADRARYSPGGHATLTVRTTNARGAPVAASVFVRVIDEKLYSMGLAEDLDPLAALYESVGDGVIGIGWTHERPSIEGGNGGGDTTGGGGGDERNDFRDLLVATLVQTGSDGRATVGVDLSDDLTSWHATASGVSSALQAGMDSILLPVGLPFFAEATIAPQYLAADRPVISVRGYGSALRTGDRVTFTVSLDTLPMAAVTVTARAFMPAEITLPKLGIGTHRVRITATTGSGSSRRQDSLIRTFTVVRSRVTQAQTTMTPLTSASPVKAGAGMTTIVLSDAGRGRVVPVLQELAWGDPLRADSTLAAALAARTLRTDFSLPIEDLEEQQGDVTRFQALEGVSVVPYASADLELSALAAIAGDPRFDRGALAGYFDELQPTTREQSAWRLAGQAATGGTVLAEIRTMAKRTDLTVREQVALAVAALTAGDEALAGQLERDVLNAHGQRMGPWVRVANDSSNLEAQLTARLAIVAASLGDPIAADMDAFLAANPPTDTIISLERALAARGWARRVPASNASAVVTVDGRRSTVHIRASEPVQLVLTPAQAAGAIVEPASGSVLVTTTTSRSFDPATLKAPDGQQLTRSVKPGTTVKATDVVVVTFRVKVAGASNEGCWMLTDMAPSGLAPIQPNSEAWDDEESESPAIYWPIDVTGQRVSFCVERDPKHPVQTLRYLARVVTAGTYRWEPAILQSALAPERGSSTPATTLTIRRLTR